MTSSALTRSDAAAGTVCFITHDAAQTRAFAAALAGAAEPGDRIALIGPLGAGKTQFAKGFAAGLGVLEVVNSPSFTLMAEYTGRIPLFHQDLFRLRGTEEVLAGGLFDERHDRGVTVSEWAERLDAWLDPHRLVLRFYILRGDERRIESSCGDAHRHARFTAAGRAWEAATRAGA